MDFPEPSIQSFIVKIWLEETVEESGEATWRGHITHVPSGVRRYLQDVQDISEFVTPYLQRMGAGNHGQRPPTSDEPKVGM